MDGLKDLREEHHAQNSLRTRRVVLAGALAGSLGVAGLMLSTTFGGVVNDAQNAHLDLESTVVVKGDEGSTALPNIVVLLLDDQGMNDMGYSSSDLASFTPNMDRLAEEGIKLSNFYSQSVCTPARAALMTGKYPFKNGMQHSQLLAEEPWGLPLTEQIFPQFLQELDYQTYMIGKWHLGHHVAESLPMNRGFDDFFGILTGGANYYNHRCTWDYSEFHEEDVPYFDLHQGTAVVDEVVDLTFIGDRFMDYSTQMYAEQVDSLLKSHQEDHVDQPFFLYYSMQAVHGPLSDPPDQILTQFEDALGDVPNNDRSTFAGMTGALDIAVNDFVLSLQDAGLYENTVIFVMSDNGGNAESGGNNYPLRGNKLFLFEGGIHVNSFIHSPLLPEETAGYTYDGLFHISDFLPTVMEGLLGEFGGLGLLDEVEIDGINQWDAILSTATTYNELGVVDAEDYPRHEIVLDIDYLDRGSNALLYNAKAGIRVDDWKLILYEEEVEWYPVPTDESTSTCVDAGDRVSGLYNIADDPYETTDVSDMYPDMVIELTSRLAAHATKMVDAEYVERDQPACYDAWDSNIVEGDEQYSDLVDGDSNMLFIGPWVKADDTQRLAKVKSPSVADWLELINNDLEAAFAFPTQNR